MDTTGARRRAARLLGWALVGVSAACGGSGSRGPSTVPASVSPTPATEPPSGYVARGRGAATPLQPSGQSSTAPSGGHGGSRASLSAPPRPDSASAPRALPAPASSGPAHVDESVDVVSRHPATFNEGASGLAAPPSPEAEFDARIVAQRIRSESSEIMRCYERELARDPRLGGGLRVEFTIQSDGSVVGVYVTENTVSPMVGECVMAIIDALHFTPGPIGGSVRYRFPFIFAPGR